ncbi:nSTAND1 domain-containing NTPase [Falsiroseomonas sp. E2-1-a20]|uniref:nSTAND1 domain-containing NTPase n=1 Tax=Falsiroseomonas sp. E2-1-a20 TaxID=3239300 RepID=UPI003F3610ED
MTAPLQQAIARLRASAAGPVIGTAFLVSPRHVMTCAHVVSEALGLAWDAAARPSETVWIEFPFTQAGQATGPATGLAASVVEWRPPSPGPAADVAVLELEREVGIRPYRTPAAQPGRGRRFWTKGFPAGHDGGMDAAGEIGTTIAHGRLLAMGNALPGFFIEGGFSGAPLLDEGSSAVLGMAAEAERDQARRTAIVVPAEQLELAWPPLARPYKSLHAFQEADARFFHGRERAIDELEAKLRQLPLVAVVGRSGSGKSSLVRAGLVPRLRAQDPWCVVTFRPGAPSSDPFSNLAAALLEATQGQADALESLQQQTALGALASSLRKDPDSIVGHLQRLTAARSQLEPVRLLLVADQFEELFTLVADPAVRSRFVRCLQAATDTSHAHEPAARCVLTIRADYMGRALEIGELVDALRDADVKLGPMTAGELRRAIEAPARSLEVAFEDGLVDELMAAVSGSGDTLPLLEFTLAELWARQRERIIRRPEAAGASNPGEVLVEPLTRHAEAVFGDLSRRFGEASFRKVLVALVWLGDPNREGEDTRRVRRKAEFDAREWELVEQLASQDRQARLVIAGASHVGGEPTVEIVHDALIRHWARLRGWLDEDRTFRLWLQKAEAEAAEWRRSGDASDLLQGRRLAEAAQWRQERAAEDLRAVADFVEASLRRREEERAQQERARQQQIAALEAEREAARAAAAEAEAQREVAEKAAAEANAQRAAALKAAAEADKQQHAARAAAAEAEAQRRIARTRFWYAVAAFSAAFLAALGAGTAAYVASSRLSEVRLAQAETLATLAEQATRRGDAMTGMLLALHSYARAHETVDDTASPVALDGSWLMNREIAVLPGRSAVFSPDGQRLVTASADGTARLWDLRGERPQATVLEGHREQVLHAAFSPDGQRLVTASEDRTARLWDLRGERPQVTVLEGHRGPVVHAAFSPDGQRLVTASWDNTARLWDLRGERPRATVLEGHQGSVRHAAFSPDGQRLVTASFDRTARLWDLRGERPQATVLDGHQMPVLHAAFSPDGQRLVTASWDDTARLWDLRGDRPQVAVLEEHREPVVHAAFSPDGQRLVTASADGTARLWDLRGERPRATVLEGHQGSVRHAAFSPDGQRLVTASWDNTARLWDLRGETPQPTVLEGHRGRVEYAAFSPDGQRLVTASEDGTARLWDLRGEPPQPTVLEGHQGSVRHAAFSPDGQRLITASWDNTARLWDLRGEPPQPTVLEGHRGPVEHAAFSPDGQRLVTASWDNTARLWNLRGERPSATVLEGHRWWVLHAAFSPDGQRLVTASADGTARLWDLRGEPPQPTVLEGHRGRVEYAAFSPDGQRLVTASWDNTARLWDLRGERPQTTVLEGHREPVLHAAFSPNGQRLVTASEDNTARLWAVFPRGDALVRTTCRSLVRGLTLSQREAVGLPQVATSSTDRQFVPLTNSEAGRLLPSDPEIEDLCQRNTSSAN